MRPRLLIPDAGRLAGEAVRLDAARSHHLVRVLRLAAGASLECFDGSGARFEARLENADARASIVRIGSRLPSPAESPLSITLVQCASSAERMDWAIEKAVELGAQAIQPLLSARSPQRLDGERAQRRREHWMRIVEAACMQCGRDRLPVLHPIQRFDDWVSQNDGDDADSLILLPGASRALSEVPIDARKPIRLLVGPESGFTDAEARLAVDSGFMPVRLGARTLRTETAGIAALAALQALAGDF